MTWDEHYRLWQDAKSNRRNGEAYEHLQSARKRVARNEAEDWNWLKASLADPVRKWFVAVLFARQPIPRRLFAAMMRAAVVDVDASTNKWLLIPCLATFGRSAVLAELEQLRSTGAATEERFEQALYWLRQDEEFARATRPPRE